MTRDITWRQFERLVALIEELAGPLWAVPLDGTKTRVTFDLAATAPELVPVPLGVARPSGQRLVFVGKGGPADVARVQVSALISYDATVLERDEGQHYTYRTPDGGVVQHSSFTAEVLGIPAVLDYQWADDGRLSSSVRWPSGLREIDTPEGSFLVKQDSMVERVRSSGHPPAEAVRWALGRWNRVAILRDGTEVAVCRFSITDEGAVRRVSHRAGVSFEFTLVHDGARGGTEISLGLRCWPQPAQPIFRYPDLISFLVAAERTCTVRFGIASGLSIDLAEGFPPLAQLGDIARMVQRVYAELGTHDPQITVAHFMDGAFRESFVLLSILLDSADLGSPVPLPDCEPSDPAVPCRWLHAVWSCPLLVPMPEGIRWLVADIEGQLAFPLGGLTARPAGVRFTRAISLKRIRDGLPAGDLQRPLLVLTPSDAYEMRGNRLQLVRPPAGVCEGIRALYGLGVAGERVG